MCTGRFLQQEILEPNEPKSHNETLSSILDYLYKL